MSLKGDVAASIMIIDAQSEPVILVGHSYGGAVITEAGTNPNVMALVYIAGFAPDKGASVNTLIADPPPGAPVPPILPPRDGFLFLDREKFHASFAGDVSDELAAPPRSARPCIRSAAARRRTARGGGNTRFPRLELRA
jgi:pimeloyl-ACP methyl ester carboxylesterase